jgi:hypothetical protein
MAQLIIYAHREVLSGRKQIFSDVLHLCNLSSWFDTRQALSSLGIVVVLVVELILELG